MKWYNSADERGGFNAKQKSSSMSMIYNAHLIVRPFCLAVIGADSAILVDECQSIVDQPLVIDHTL